MRAAWWIGFAAVAVSAPAQAQSVAVNVPAGRAGDVAAAVARQTGASIVVAGEELANRRVPPIKGQFTAGQAVERLAGAAGARAVPVGARAWRLVPAATAGAGPGAHGGWSRPQRPAQDRARGPPRDPRRRPHALQLPRRRLRDPTSS